MKRFFAPVGYFVCSVGALSLVLGLFAMNLTPMVLGTIMIALGGILLLLVEMNKNFRTIAATGRYFAVMETTRASDPSKRADLESSESRVSDDLSEPMEPDQGERGFVHDRA